MANEDLVKPVGNVDNKEGTFELPSKCITQAEIKDATKWEEYLETGFNTDPDTWHIEITGPCPVVPQPPTPDPQIISNVPTNGNGPSGGRNSGKIISGTDSQIVQVAGNEITSSDIDITYTSGLIRIELSEDNSNNYNSALFDVNGQRVMEIPIEKKLTQADLSLLPSGIYIYHIFDAKKGSITNQIINHIK